MKIFYDKRMDVEGEGAKFDIHKKAGLLRAYVEDLGLPLDWCACSAVPWDAWSRVHDAAYLNGIQNNNEDILLAASMEPSDDLLDAQRWAAGSLLDACRAAKETGVAFSPSSHFHHAHYDRPGIFCLLNGLVLAALELLDGGCDRVLILDCDYHYGNGTDDILSHLGEDRIVNVSLGKTIKRKSQNKEYLKKMREVAKDIESNAYDFVIYQAGMDVLIGDPSGGGVLNYAEIFKRETIVFESCRNSNTPVVWNVAGGYKTDETGAIIPILRGYLNTLLAALSVYGEVDDDVFEKLGYRLV